MKINPIKLIAVFLLIITITACQKNDPLNDIPKPVQFTPQEPITWQLDNGLKYTSLKIVRFQ